ncbi:MAG: hypothetical protein GY801_00870 [bacterium]|nr:hypothetical protein [bacterium]
MTVLEFEPYDYSNGQRESPNALGSEDPEGWKQYWYDCLACSGITDLHPIENTWFVNIDEIQNSKTLNTYVVDYLKDIENKNDLDEYYPLSGGYIVQQHNILCVFPACCGDLSNLDEWKKAVAEKNDEWKMLWIGHPWVHYRTNGAYLELSEPSEAKAPISDKTYLIPKGELHRAIRNTEIKLAEFAGKVKKHLKDNIPDEMIDDVITVMIEGHSNE